MEPPQRVETVPVPPQDGKTWDALTIPVSTQGESGDLRIGVGEVRDGEYADAGGAKRRALLASLWIYVRADKSKNQTVDAHAGQTLQAGAQTVYVEEVRSGRRGSVRLLVSPAAPPKP